ncbi:MAG: hypothetical protein IJS57_05625 [Paludibacteraceae bacterium]|nr:hypothetical protein [Paludibacteraceae bacterium]
MGYYKLIRESPDGKAVRGTLCTVEHRYSGSAGEYREYLTPVCPTLENSDYLIPALVYKVSVTQSPRFRRLLPYLNQVPGRSGIRVHRGTRPEHSKGCILVSPENERLITELWLKEQQNHEEIFIEICA